MPKATTADAELLLHLYEIRREPELRRARAWFLTQFKPSSWAEIKARYLSHSDEDRWFRMTISYWEMVGTLVNRGVLDADLFFDHTGEDVVTWERCKPWIAEARADIRPTYLYQFERMVAAHLAFRARVNAAIARSGGASAWAAAAAGGAKAPATKRAPAAKAARPRARRRG
jgi:hypothetical protein